MSQPKRYRVFTQPTPEQIKELREQVKLSQRNAAEVTYVTKATWQNWESGRTQIPLAIWENFLHKTKQRPMPVIGEIVEAPAPIDPRVQANLDEWMQTEEDKMIDREMAIWQIRKQKESEREEWMKMEERVRQEEEERARLMEAKEALKRGTVFDDRDIEEAEHE